MRHTTAALSGVDPLTARLEDWIFFAAYGLVALQITASFLLTCAAERSLRSKRPFRRIIRSLAICFLAFYLTGYVYGRFAVGGDPGVIGANINDICRILWRATMWIALGRSAMPPYLLRVLHRGCESLTSQVMWVLETAIGIPDFVWKSPFLILSLISGIVHAAWARSVLHIVFRVQISELIWKLVFKVSHSIKRSRERLWPTPRWLETSERSDAVDCRICWGYVQAEAAAYTCPYNNCSNSFHRKCIARLADSPAGAEKCPLCQRPTFLAHQTTN